MASAEIPVWVRYMTARHAEDLPAPHARRVARRAMVLSAVVCRGNSDREPTNGDAIALRERILAWVARMDLDAEFEPAERQLLNAPLGTLDEQARIRAAWRVEGLAILGWALQRSPFPQHDEQVDPYKTTADIEFLRDEAAEILRSPNLRSREELDACRELLYALHCRLRECLRVGSARQIYHWIEPDWLRILGIESPLGPDGDLRIGTTEIAQAERHVVQHCEWTLSERHRAIIWLTGDEGPTYSTFTVDT